MHQIICVHVYFCIQQENLKLYIHIQTNRNCVWLGKDNWTGGTVMELFFCITSIFSNYVNLLCLITFKK